MIEWRAPEPDRPMLDTGYLARLGGHVGAVALAELLTDGLIELADRMARLDEAAGDPDAIARLAHDLVGMAGHLGLARLSAAAAEAHRLVRDGADGDAAPLVAEVRRLGADSAEAIRRHLDAVSGR